MALQLFSQHNTTVQISTPNDVLHLTILLTANQVNEVVLPTDIYYSSGSDAYGNKGIKIVSQDSIQVIAMHYRVNFSDASLVLPVQDLDTSYVGTAFYDMTPVYKGVSEIVIVSTQDHNIISITPSDTLTSGRPAGQTYSVYLDAGQTYQIQSFSDLSGTKVRANQKIAVFGGVATGYVFSGKLSGANNHLWDETFPTSLWSTHYIAIPFLNEGNSPCHVVANEDSTLIYVNCNLTAILMKGEAYTFFITYPSLVESSKPVALSEMINSLSATPDKYGDPSFLNLLPANYFSKIEGFNCSNSINGAGSYYFTEHFANVIVPADAVDDFIIDGINISKDSFHFFNDDTRYAYAQLQLKPGYHIFQCSKGFNAAIYGKGYYDAYSFTAGFQTIKPDSAIQIGNANNCLGNPTDFNYISTDSLSGFAWNFGDHTTSTKQNTSHIYSKPGNYIAYAKGYTKDGCLRTYSEEITIEDCNQGCSQCNSDFCTVSMYPNPGHVINIDADQAKNISFLQVTDALGRVVYSMNNNDGKNLPTSIDLSLLKTAIYFLTVVCDGGRSTEKILIQGEY